MCLPIVIATLVSISAFAFVQVEAAAVGQAINKVLVSTIDKPPANHLTPTFDPSWGCSRLPGETYKANRISLCNLRNVRIANPNVKVEFGTNVFELEIVQAKVTYDYRLVDAIPLIEKTFEYHFADYLTFDMIVTVSGDKNSCNLKLDDIKLNVDKGKFIANSKTPFYPYFKELNAIILSTTATVLTDLFRKPVEALKIDCQSLQYDCLIHVD